MKKSGLGYEAANRINALRGEARVAQEGTYQGFKNYETFTVAVILENNQGDYEYWHERAQEIQGEIGEGYEESEYWKPEEKVIFSIADEMEAQFRDQKEEFNLPAPFGTLLNAALDEVNWREVAESMLTE